MLLQAVHGLDEQSVVDKAEVSGKTDEENANGDEYVDVIINDKTSFPEVRMMVEEMIKLTLRNYKLLKSLQKQ